VPTDTATRGTPAASFALRLAAWSLGLFGVLRWSWTDAHVVLPLARVQGHLAAALFGAPAAPVEVTTACSGTDALTLCLAAVLAYPAPWRTRLPGAVAGAAVIVALNTIRIGTLGAVAGSPNLFAALHLYVWPALLTLAIAGYVLAWMHVADRHPSLAWRPRPTLRFVALASMFLVLFVAASPLYLESASVLAAGGLIAHAAAAILSAGGGAAHATGNVLWTGRGGFTVTQECIATPLIPIYLAALCTSPTWRRLIVGGLAAVPLFVALGLARVLVVALPEVRGSPLFLVHAFYQLLLGVVVVALAAAWRPRGAKVLPRALAGIAAGVLLLAVLGPVYTRLAAWAPGAPLVDPQGAMALCPSFQTAMYGALWVATFAAAGWMRFGVGLAILGLTQAAGLLVVHVLASSASLTPHVRDVRGWAVVVPVVIFAAVIQGAHARR
jgi:exosortase/archaeosortase family protein